MWAVRSSGFCFPFSVLFICPLPPPPGCSSGFSWDLPSFENLLSSTLWHPASRGGGHSWRPSQELRVRAGRHEAVDIFGVFWFGFCFFLNRAILCSVQAVKKNIYQCFPIKYSDYLMGSGPLVLVSGLAPARTPQPWPGRAFLPCSLQRWILITATNGGPVSWSSGPSQRGHSGLSAHHTSAQTRTCERPSPPLGVGVHQTSGQKQKSSGSQRRGRSWEPRPSEGFSGCSGDRVAFTE